MVTQRNDDILGRVLVTRCMGNDDTYCIGIRSLQTILLKISLIVGVQYHMEVTYKEIVEPQDSTEGWSIGMEPVDHPITQLSFDAIIGCEGTNSGDLTGRGSEVNWH